MLQLLRIESVETPDQLKGIIQMYKSNWKSKPVETKSNLKYTENPSMFNAILHFVDDKTLSIKDNTEVVCNSNAILRWHTLTTALGEDLFICAYLAAKDLNTIKNVQRNHFNWIPYIKTDDISLNHILESPLADIHAHLKGSSLNYDINWMCLMNHIDNRLNDFQTISKTKQGDSIHLFREWESLYVKAVQAATLRLYLLQDTWQEELISIDFLDSVLKESDALVTSHFALELQQIITTAQYLHGKEYSNQTEKHIYDYAICDGLTIPFFTNETCAYSLLSGERYFLYKNLKEIYNDEHEADNKAWLFYMYLLIKNEIRQEICQTNTSVGFDNFATYEQRKLIFTERESLSYYEHAALHLSVGSFFVNICNDGENRYHETRITPKNEASKIVDSIIENDIAITDPQFSNDINIWNYKYIFHFIKQEDRFTTTKNKASLSLFARHHRLRKKIKEEARAIYDFRNSLTIAAASNDFGNFQNDKTTYLADRVVGIDAANSEIACRPEVFGQAFRYLRQHSIEHLDLHCPKDLGITYHVGEDFMDVVDGLRAIDEAILFLELQKGDRIGHALALGVRVKKYYETRNFTIAMPLQMQLDNTAWLYRKLTDLGYQNKTTESLKRKYGFCFRMIYPGRQTPEIDIYYQSMLLRGDNPELYQRQGKLSVTPLNTILEWDRKAFVNEKACIDARKQKDVCELYYLYHFDPDGKLNGQKYEEWEFDDELCSMIEIIQEEMLNKVEELGLAIECNPTSNFKIGEFSRYDEHPITKFNSSHLNTESRHQISVSINTDDKGVFSTSIEREYALMAHALIRVFHQNKNGTTNADVYKWLDRVRQYSLEQQFNNR